MSKIKKINQKFNVLVMSSTHFIIHKERPTCCVNEHEGNAY